MDTRESSLVGERWMSRSAREYPLALGRVSRRRFGESIAEQLDVIAPPSRDVYTSQGQEVKIATIEET